MKDKYWELGRKILVGGAAVVLLSGICLGTGAAQTGGDTAAPAPTASAQAAISAVEDAKEEVVYATLSAGGTVDAVYVVNHFITTPGTGITDYGDYTEVANLTDTGELAVEEGAVSFTADTDSFYYQGNLGAADLPWKFDIGYRMDGKAVSPADLAGKSGELEISLKSSRDPKVDQVFYDNYMLQIQVTLPGDRARNVDAPGAVLAAAGSDQVYSYTVLPGKDAGFILSADVTDFEMPGISIAGMPYSIDFEFPDIGDSLSDLEKLPDAISQLNEGVSELESGTRDMRSGTEELRSGSAGIQSGLSLLSGSGASLKSGSAQIRRGLGQIASSLAESDLDSIDLSGVEALPASLGQLREGLVGLSDGLSQLEGGFGGAYAALEDAISGIPGPEVSQSDIENVMAQLSEPGDLYVVGALAANYEAAQTVRGTFSQVRTAFDSVEPVLSEVTGGIDQMADQLGSTLGSMEEQLSGLGRLSELGQLQSGLEELAASYRDFDDGLAGYVAGVSELSSNYKSFHAGIGSLTSGVGDLHAGVGELHAGTETLNEEIADLPDLIQAEIDKMKEEYLPPDFTPVSFTSPRNEDTTFVQFVLQCSGIEKPETAAETNGDEQEAEQSFWDRLAGLFS